MRVLGAQVDEEMLGQVDQIARDQDVNRSEVVRRSIRFYAQVRPWQKIQDQKDRLMDREENLLVGWINRIRNGKSKRSNRSPNNSASGERN
jgi:predicted transcriptional regulator